MKKYYGMKIIQTLGFLVIVIVASASSTIAQTMESQNWVGVYNFTDTAQASKRRNRYDVAPTTEYIIKVSKNKEKLTATFEINGMQIFEVYNCSLDARSEKLNFYFQSGGIPGGGTENPRNFKKGTLLFSLIKSRAGKSTKYLFQAADFKVEPLNTRAPKAAVYFNKQ